MDDYKWTNEMPTQEGLYIINMDNKIKQFTENLIMLNGDLVDEDGILVNKYNTGCKFKRLQ